MPEGERSAAGGEGGYFSNERHVGHPSVGCAATAYAAGSLCRCATSPRSAGSYPSRGAFAGCCFFSRYNLSFIIPDSPPVRNRFRAKALTFCRVLGGLAVESRKHFCSYKVLPYTL